MLELTKEIIKNLHDDELQCIVVRRDSKGTGLLELSFKGEYKGREVESRKSYLVPVNLHSYAISNYEVDPAERWEYKTNPNACASAVIFIYKGQSTIAESILTILKAGDKISFEFIANNNNGYVNKARLHHDILEIKIKRGNKTLVFQLDDSICPDNSARMIDETGCFRMYDIDTSRGDIENKI